MKSCCDCLEVKPKTDFHLTRACKDGLSRRCKECARAKTRKYRARQKDKHKPTPEVERLQKQEFELELAWRKAMKQKNQKKADKIRKRYEGVQVELQNALRGS